MEKAEGRPKRDSDEIEEAAAAVKEGKVKDERWKMMKNYYQEDFSKRSFFQIRNFGTFLHRMLEESRDCQ